MIKHKKEILKELSKEQLIYLIEQMNHSLFLISCVCVDESKWHIESDEAVDKIRNCIYDMPSLHDAEKLKNFIDMKIGKKSIKEYREFLELDSDEEDVYYVDPEEDTVLYKIKEFRKCMTDEKEHELTGIYSSELAHRIDREIMEAKNELIDDLLHYFDSYFEDFIYEECEE